VAAGGSTFPRDALRGPAVPRAARRGGEGGGREGHRRRGGEGGGPAGQRRGAVVARYFVVNHHGALSTGAPPARSRPAASPPAGSARRATSPPAKSTSSAFLPALPARATRPCLLLLYGRLGASGQRRQAGRSQEVLCAKSKRGARDPLPPSLGGSHEYNARSGVGMVLEHEPVLSSCKATASSGSAVNELW
jgi:hypothetical protein